MDIAALKDMLKVDEDEKLRPYPDSKGKLTIGVGRNLSDTGISLVESDFLLTNDITRVQAGLNLHISWWLGLSGNRQLVVANVAFNCGVDGLLGFHNFLAALRAGHYSEAAAELLDSDAARDLPKRYARLAVLVEQG